MVECRLSLNAFQVEMLAICTDKHFELKGLLYILTLQLDLPCSGPVTHSGEILTTGKSHGKKPDRHGIPLKTLLDT